MENDDEERWRVEDDITPLRTLKTYTLYDYLKKSRRDGDTAAWTIEIRICRRVACEFPIRGILRGPPTPEITPMAVTIISLTVYLQSVRSPQQAAYIILPYGSTAAQHVHSLHESTFFFAYVASCGSGIEASSQSLSKSSISCYGKIPANRK